MSEKRAKMGCRLPEAHAGMLEKAFLKVDMITLTKHPTSKRGGCGQLNNGGSPSVRESGRRVTALAARRVEMLSCASPRKFRPCRGHCSVASLKRTSTNSLLIYSAEAFVWGVASPSANSDRLHVTSETLWPDRSRSLEGFVRTLPRTPPRGVGLGAAPRAQRDGLSRQGIPANPCCNGARPIEPRAPPAPGSSASLRGIFPERK